MNIHDLIQYLWIGTWDVHWLLVLVRGLSGGYSYLRDNWIEAGGYTSQTWCSPGFWQEACVFHMTSITHWRLQLASCRLNDPKGTGEDASKLPWPISVSITCHCFSQVLLLAKWVLPCVMTDDCTRAWMWESGGHWMIRKTGFHQWWWGQSREAFMPPSP